MDLPFELLLYTDRLAAGAAGRTVEDTVARALDVPGAERVAVLLRDKAADDRSLLARAEALAARCRARGATFLVHTSTDVARAVDADGVQLGGHGRPRVASDALGPGKLVGWTRHRGDRLDDGDSDLMWAHWVVLSPVFRPTSKPEDRRTPFGLDVFSGPARSITPPAVALGGVTPDNAGACRAAGARAVAVLGFVMSAPDPGAAVSALLAAWDGG